MIIYSGVSGRRGELQGDTQLTLERDREGVDPAAGAVAAPKLGRPQGWEVLERVVVRVGAGHACKLVWVVAHRGLRFAVHIPGCSEKCVPVRACACQASGCSSALHGYED